MLTGFGKRFPWPFIYHYFLGLSLFFHFLILLLSSSLPVIDFTSSLFCSLLTFPVLIILTSISYFLACQCVPVFCNLSCNQTFFSYLDFFAFIVSFTLYVSSSYHPNIDHLFLSLSNSVSLQSSLVNPGPFSYLDFICITVSVFTDSVHM